MTAETNLPYCPNITKQSRCGNCTNTLLPNSRSTALISPLVDATQDSLALSFVTLQAWDMDGTKYTTENVQFKNLPIGNYKKVSIKIPKNEPALALIKLSGQKLRVQLSKRTGITPEGKPIIPPYTPPFLKTKPTKISQIKSIDNSEPLVLQEINIPEEVQNLDGYGEGLSFNECNYIDFIHNNFVKTGKVVEVGEVFKTTEGHKYTKGLNIDSHSNNTFDVEGVFNGGCNAKVFMNIIPAGTYRINIQTQNYFITTPELPYDGTSEIMIFITDLETQSVLRRFDANINTVITLPNDAKIEYIVGKGGSAPSDIQFGFDGTITVSIYGTGNIWEFEETPVVTDISQYLKDAYALRVMPSTDTDNNVVKFISEMNKPVPYEINYIKKWSV